MMVGSDSRAKLNQSRIQVGGDDGIPYLFDMLKQWFEVDRRGLEKLQGRRGADFMLYELVQNAWDQDVTQVSVRISPVPGKPLAELVVEDDDPNGFRDISHAFTLFAESDKKSDCGKRGRFNFGEKLVLARCAWAEIVSTQHAIRFDDDGRHSLRQRTEKGTRFTAQFRCLHGDIEDIEKAARRLLVPTGIRTSINGVDLPSRVPAAKAKSTLPTEFADSHGVLKRTARQTDVFFYQPGEGEEPWLYEMGIPVCPHNGKYHYDVGQKIPLGMERDAVSQSYVEKLHALAFNTLYGSITEADATSEWVKVATEAPGVLPAAVNRYMDLSFGEKRVSYDPSDKEANHLAASKGYTVVSGGMMSADAWKNARDAGAILAAGKVTPSPKPYSPDGDALRYLPIDKITPDMRQIEKLACRLAGELMGVRLTVRWVDEPDWGVLATYGPASPLVLNATLLGHDWLTISEPMASEKVLDLLIHEFGHQYEGNHLSSGYHDALTLLGARLTRLAAQDPGVIRYE
jgi:hypothetical protein